MRVASLFAGLSALAAVWLLPLTREVAGPFTAHMVAHLGVVAVAAPLLALGAAGRWWDPVRTIPGIFAPLPISALELLVVWSWHAPMLHHAAGGSPSVRALEQGSFLVVGLLLWLSVLGGAPDRRDERRGAGVLALLLTSMHMTLLGALLALSPRALYAPAGDAGGVVGRLADQHLGGALMIAVGGATYLFGGLALTLGLLGGSSAEGLGAVEERRT